MPPKATANQLVLVPINGYSDGDVSHRPAQLPYAPYDPALYLEKLAKKWMEDSGMAEPGDMLSSPLINLIVAIKGPPLQSPFSWLYAVPLQQV